MTLPEFYHQLKEEHRQVPRKYKVIAAKNNLSFIKQVFEEGSLARWKVFDRPCLITVSRKEKNLLHFL